MGHTSQMYFFADIIDLLLVINPSIIYIWAIDSPPRTEKTSEGGSDDGIIENHKDRKWKREWQLPSIPSKHVLEGHKGKGQGESEVSAQLCAMRRVQSLQTWPLKSPLPPGVTHNTSGPDSPSQPGTVIRTEGLLLFCLFVIY